MEVPEPDETGRGKFGVALGFLAPALVILGGLVIYPAVFTVWRSLYSAAPTVDFIALDNYVELFTSSSTLTAVKNNFVWVLVAPTAVTAFGLVFAVLIDRVRLQTAYKTVLFMPMAISYLAVGIIFRLVYQDNPDIGLANALVTGVKSVFSSTGAYPGAIPSVEENLQATGEGGYVTTSTTSPGDAALLGLVGIPPEQRPAEPTPAVQPQDVADDAIAGTVWFDFSPDGERGTVDQSEQGLPGIPVEAVQNGEVVASATTGPDGTYELSGLDPGDYELRLAAPAFAAAAQGINWLGDQQWLYVSAATWAIIAAYVWMHTGFAVIVLSAGLSSLPREVMESARVDGASEWQVFRRVTVPLLRPVILVVIVTLMISVLKIFDLVLVMAPGNVRDDANVLAVRMFEEAFVQNDFGMGSAITIVLFLLVVPAMLFNIRRFQTQ